jgi:predicted nuclease of restriction endonuclease-like (RecB) superfamily
MSDKIIVKPELFNDVRQFIETARMQVARYANSASVMLYWQIGHRINQDILKNARAEYGEKVISEIAKFLKEHYGSAFDRYNLSRMVRFAKIYSEPQIVVTLSQQLTWSHFVKLIIIDDSLKRDFYTEMCRLQGWTVRGLREKIDSMLYERTAIAKQPEPVIKAELKKLKQGDLTNPDLYLQDPCVLKLLYPHQITSERKLEAAILHDLQIFIQDMGSDFCFLAKQKKMSTEKNDRFLDLLFFHRGMRRLIAIELKFSAFQPEHAGQMEWYLKWLDKHEKRPGEEKPLGIIICSDKDQEDVELMELGKNGIHVTQYLTELPPKEILEKRLKKVIEIAREKYERLKLLSNDDD